MFRHIKLALFLHQFAILVLGCCHAIMIFMNVANYNKYVTAYTNLQLFIEDIVFYRIIYLIAMNIKNIGFFIFKLILFYDSKRVMSVLQVILIAF